MPKFTIRSENAEPAAIEAADWSGALSKLVGRFTGQGNTVHVDVNDKGATEIWDERSEMRFQMDSDTGTGTGFELTEDPTTDLWDAPNPGSGARTASTPNDAVSVEMANSAAALTAEQSDAGACETAMNLLLTHIPAESGSVLLAEGPYLRFISVRGPHAENLVGTTIPIDKGVAGTVANSGRALLVREARQNPQHDSSVDHTINHVTRTLLAVPIESNGSVLGVIELLNPFGSDTFMSWHQEFARDVANALGQRFLPG
jgi:putative methionine-R-sulfoxide reductase with GAF domain